MATLKLKVDTKHRLLMLNICNVDEYFQNSPANLMTRHETFGYRILKSMRSLPSTAAVLNLWAAGGPWTSAWWAARPGWKLNSFYVCHNP